VGVVCLTSGNGERASDRLRTLPQRPLSAPDCLQASEPCHHTGTHAKTSVRAATPSAGSGQQLACVPAPIIGAHDEPNERDSGFSQACHGWHSASRAACPTLSCSPGWRSTVRCTGDHQSVSSAQRGAVNEVTQLPALPRSGTYALFFDT